MADTEKLTKGIESATAMLEQLGKAFEELESQRESFLQNKIQWDGIKEHFHDLERSLKNKCDELEEKQGVFEEKQSRTRALIAEREAAVAAKEQASSNSLQELRDIAVSAIAEARQKYKVASPEPVDIRGSKAKKLTESFPPVPLLKAYLEDLKNAEKNGNGDGQKDPNAQELGALKAVIKCIEEYKLQEEYPIEPLQKRVAQLEKAKYDKKRMGEAVKLQTKKPRDTGGYAPRRPAFVPDSRQLPPPAFDERRLYAGAVERYPERYPYNAPPTYEPPAYAAYAQQLNARGPYHYPDERFPAAPYDAASNYWSYTGAGLQSAPNSYGNYTGTGNPSSSSNYGGYPGSGL